LLECPKTSSQNDFICTKMLNCNWKVLNFGNSSMSVFSGKANISVRINELWLEFFEHSCDDKIYW
jgi:hypothetical protein